MIEVMLILLVLGLIAAPARRSGCGVNDLRRWKQYGGTLQRPAPPGPVR
jgi:hypothetical protein